MSKQKPTLAVVPYFPWEAPGHLTYERQRYQLVGLLDTLITHLSLHNHAAPHILVGGYSALAQDYLSVRQGRAEALRELLASERLWLGPWYAVPDPGLVSPEALIRNLELGLANGPKPPLALIEERSGRVRQLAQILRGFGIEAVLTSGSEAATRTRHAPDGSQIMAIIPVIGSHLEDAVDNLPSGTYLALIGLDTAAELDSLPEQIAAIGDKGTKAHLLNHLEMDAGDELPPSPPDSTLSARIRLKQSNFNATALLQRWLEPMMAWASLLERGRTQAGVDTVNHLWRLLLSNHDRMMLQGRVSDAVYEEVLTRYEQTIQVTRDALYDCVETVTQHIDTTGQGDGQKIVVYNQAPNAQSALVIVSISDPGESFIIQSVDGTRAAHSVIDDEQEDGSLTVQFCATDVPPHGYRTYALEPGEAQSGVIIDEGYSIENDYLNLTLDIDEGTVTLYDKRTGRSFEGLNRFVDGGDAGSVVAYTPPERDTLLSIPTNTPLPTRRRIAPDSQILEILAIYRLPESLTPDRTARLPLAAQFVPVSVTTVYTIPANAARVDVEVVISNSARDHRLRVHFPFMVSSPSVFVDGPFIVEHHTSGQTSTMYNQHGFITLQGAETGLTIANRGLPEVGIEPARDGYEIALTLLRSVGRLGDGSQLAAPGAQCYGEYVAEYSIIPHGEDPLPAWQQAWAYQVPLDGVVTDVHSGDLPGSCSLVRSDNPYFVISAVRLDEAGERLLVRGYSISDEAQHVTLHTAFDTSEAKMVMLDGATPRETLHLESGGYSFEVGPFRVVTLALATE